MTSKTKTVKPRRIAHEPEFPFTRGARIGLLALLIVTVCFAAGVLFIKFQLESFRAEVEAGLETSIGARLTLGTVSVNGLRGLRIDNLRVDVPLDQGPVITLETPIALIDINLNDLFYADITVDRILLDNSHVLIERPEEAPWYTPKGPALEESLPIDLNQEEPFRVVGANCVLEVRNIVGGTELRVEPFRFDVGRQVGSQELTAALEGMLSNNPEKNILVSMSMASIEDFDVRVQTSLITAEDVNVVLPSPQHLVTAGQAHPTLRVYGGPDRTLIVSLRAPFENVTLRDHPEFLEPATGTLTFLATYSTEDHELMVSTAKAESDQLSGELDGTVEFTTDYPIFDLTLEATRIPVDEIMEYLLSDELAKYGEMDVVLEEPHSLTVSLTGTSENPVVSATASAGSGRFSLLPENDDYPPMSLTLGKIEGGWNSETQEIVASCDVLDGDVYHYESRIEAHEVSGTLTFSDGVIAMAPLNATIRDNAFVGDLEYEIESGDARVEVEGTLARLEDTMFADMFKDTKLSGAIKLKGSAWKVGDRYIIDTELDATQSQIDYQWWFSKPVGLGANGRIQGEILPGEKANFDAEAEVASSFLFAEVELVDNGNAEGSWALQRANATAERIDINAVTKCAIIPYRITGGIGRLGHFEYTRDPEDPSLVHQTMGCYIDDVTILSDLPDALPLQGTGFTIEVAMNTLIDGQPGSTGEIWLHGHEAEVPPLGVPWMVELNPPPEWPRRERNWTYQLATDRLQIPPWKGENFRGTAYINEDQSGFNSYSAEIDGGRLSGNYHGTKSENSYVTEISWENIPAHYFLEHLEYPEVLDGTMSGEVGYSLDQDDPGTLRGEGYFEITDGRFGADFLYTMLEGRLGDQMATLPPSLDFSFLRADIELVGDTVKTPTLKLDADAIALDGKGQYIRDGDMDYDIHLAVDPETAANIPVMLENFNIQGHRLSNQDIELSFHIGGPTFNPQGELADLPPASVTLVSGALEVTREAINIIDLPRKILVGLLKMGGGIVGSGGGNQD